jgi:carbamoyl-phosphate synthase large subunit
MKSAVRVLFLSAGRRVELLGAFRESARELGLDLSIFAADASPSASPACVFAEEAIRSPLSASVGFDDWLHTTVDSRDIDLVVPTTDHDLLPLSRLGVLNPENAGCFVVSTLAAIETCRDKLRTMNAARGSDLLKVPASSFLSAVESSNLQFTEGPLVLKPNNGSSSVGLHFVDSLNQAAQIIPADQWPTYLVQERVSGPEYTVSCFRSFETGKLYSSVAHERIRTRSGEVSHGVTREIPEIDLISAHLVANIPGLRGPFCYQVIKENGSYYLIEINARFGGGYPLAHRAGLKSAEFLLRKAAGLPEVESVEITPNLEMLRYDSSVFQTVQPS